MHDIIIGGTFTEPTRAIISARSEVHETEYFIAIGKKRDIWLYHPSQSSVYCSGGKGSRGFGGSTVRFKLAGGLGHIDLVGPWHSNSESFFRDTGIDVRQNHVTWGCIGTGRDVNPNGGGWRITGVIWFDEAPTKGSFERVDELAQKMADERNEVLYCYRESSGGSSFGNVNPGFDRVAHKAQADKFWESMEQ